ncbi:hypothetical protein M8C21_003085 [Ambrosia artemisiifolia]|uniref:Uncharacterized protein n=1 Tax=Ambrosia artemisiifolia TaxID=4212 RepID=A0AAD5D2W1_AMBAR|nr:hypothetical protein M8C21_003085 [Ambrosia artemisiifolia]
MNQRHHTISISKVSGYAIEVHSLNLDRVYRVVTYNTHYNIRIVMFSLATVMRCSLSWYRANKKKKSKRFESILMLKGMGRSSIKVLMFNGLL